MDKRNISKIVLSNFIWRFLERCGAQGVTFIVTIILARMLKPSDYGIIAIVTVFTTIMQVFIDSGLGNALIQKKEVDDIDYSSVFYFNITVCLILYGIMCLIAPLIASFYNLPELTLIIRVSSLTLIVSGVRNIQQAYISRNLLFQKFFYATLTGTIGSAVIGIFLAVEGFGVWALVIQNIFNITLSTFLLWLFVHWRPKVVFSWHRLKILLSFGDKILLSSLIDTVYNDLRQLIMGKIYSSANLAYYNRGQQYSAIFVNNINIALDSILLPVLSSEQDNRKQLCLYTRRAVKISSYIMMPLMMMLAVCAEPIVRITLTDKWIDTVFFLRVFCFNYAFYPLHTANLNAIKACGRSDIVLKIEILKKVVGCIAVVATMWISVKALACSLIINTIFNIFINSYPNYVLLEYGLKSQFKDILPSVVMTIIMGAFVYTITFAKFCDLMTLFLQIIAGILVYVICSQVSSNENYEYMRSLIRSLL